MSFLKYKIFYGWIIASDIFTACHVEYKYKNRYTYKDLINLYIFIKYLINYIRELMPPKKKNAATKKDDQPQVTVKPTTQEPKKQTKQVKESASEAKPVQVKKDIKKPEDPRPAQPTIVKTDSETHKKINLSATENLSQAEILQRRKLRFNAIGTEVDPQQAERLKKQRISKFGGQQPQSKQELERRKQKFGIKGSIDLNQELQDKDTIEKRRQKFGGETQAKDDPAIIEERKKKFGGNDISLDDMITKDKQRKQHKDHKDQHQHRDNRDQRDHRDHRDNRDHRREKNHSQDRYQSNHKKFKR